MENIILPEAQLAQKAKAAVGQVMADADAEFWSFVKGLPSMIVQNGLIQTLAFLKSKEEPKYKKIYDALNEYIEDLVGSDFDGELDILTFLIDEMHDIRRYMYYQEQALKFSIWFKRIGLALKQD